MFTVDEIMSSVDEIMSSVDEIMSSVDEIMFYHLLFHLGLRLRIGKSKCTFIHESILPN